MTALEERTKCRCGLPMLTTEGGAKFCENCDWVQPKQFFGLERDKTVQDVRFDMSWLRTINQEYDKPLPEGEDGKWEYDSTNIVEDDDD